MKYTLKNICPEGGGGGTGGNLMRNVTFERNIYPSFWARLNGASFKISAELATWDNMCIVTCCRRRYGNFEDFVAKIDELEGGMDKFTLGYR